MKTIRTLALVAAIALLNITNSVQAMWYTDLSDDLAPVYMKLIANGMHSFKNGDCTAQEFEHACAYFEQSANQDGDLLAKAHAHAALGTIYTIGYDNSTIRDYNKAYHYFTLAATQTADPGIKVRADLCLGEFHFYGIGDKSNAKHFFELAANQDYDKQVKAQSFTWFGIVHYCCLHQPEIAKGYFEAALKQNRSDRANRYANLYLGEMYFFGHGVEQNFGQALRHFKGLARQDRDFWVKMYAYVRLAALYYAGIGGGSLQKALEYAEVVANQDKHPQARDLAIEIIRLIKYPTNWCGTIVAPVPDSEQQPVTLVEHWDYVWLPNNPLQL